MADAAVRAPRGPAGYLLAVDADDAPDAVPTVRAQYDLWLVLARGELTEEEAARRHGLDVAAVRRIADVAEQGALAALSAAGPDTTAQVGGSAGGSGSARTSVVDLLDASPVFFGVHAQRRAELARRATLVVLGARSAVADRLAAAPLLVARGTLLVRDRDDRPVDLVGRRAFRGPRAGRRVVPMTDTQVAVLPRVTADVTAADVRDRLDAGAPLGVPAGPEAGDVPPAMAAMTVGEIADGGPRPDGAGGRHVELSTDAPLLDAVTAMLATGASAVDVEGGGSVAVDDLPGASEGGLAEVLAALGGARRVDQLTGVVSGVRRLLRTLVGAGADVTDAGRVQAAVADALTRRLLRIARTELGDAPVDFAWLVFGSHARREQTPGSDQDHGLVYAAGLDAAGHQWFAALGDWMTAALEACGYRRCPGGVMASQPAWRHDLDGWSRAVAGWTDSADSAGLVGADIGFDVRAVTGTGTLAAGDVADRLRRSVAEATRGELTAARLASAAVARRPPNPLWGRVGRNPLGPAGGRLGRFDLKRDGVQPIVDLARVHALVRGGREVGTPERLAAAAAEGQISPDLAATLVEGLRLLWWTRLSTQLGDPAEGDDVDWRRLPPAVRRQVSETFGAVRAAQDALRVRYHLAPGR